MELPACLIPEGFSECSEVQVAALASIQDADTLKVEPLTCEDWELLETAAEFLEDGALLRQVSVVYSAQTIPLWVGGHDFAWIRILPENFHHRSSVWPGSNNNQSSCLRLVRDIRVVVAPKARRKHEPRSCTPLRVFPTKEDYSTPMNQLAAVLGKEQVSTTPGTILLCPATKLSIPGLNADDTNALVLLWNAANGSSSPDTTTQSCVLQVAFSNGIPENHVGEFLLAIAVMQYRSAFHIKEDPNHANSENRMWTKTSN